LIDRCVVVNQIDTATAALKVAGVLKTIAGLGLSVVTVIHQPRSEIFQEFDDLILMVPGGQVAFIGAREDAIQYFLTQGFMVRI